MIKNFFKYCFISSILVWVISSQCFWVRWNNGESDWNYGKLDAEFTYKSESTEALTCTGNTDLWNCVSVKEDKQRDDETIIRRLLWVFWLDTSKDKDLKFIDYARAILNMALGLLAFIALIMTIYTFYMMFFTDDEAWTKKAKQSLIGIFIALGIIWLAWIIVSFIFWWYQSNWKDKEDQIQGPNVSTIWEFYDNNN